MSLLNLPNEILDIIINSISDIITLVRLNGSCKFFNLDIIRHKSLCELINKSDLTKLWNIKHHKWIYLFGNIKDLPYPECSFNGINENSMNIIIESIKKNNFITMNFALHLSLCFDILSLINVKSIIKNFIKNNKHKCTTLLKSKAFYNKYIKKMQNQTLIVVPYLYLTYFLGTESMVIFILEHIKLRQEHNHLAYIPHSIFITKAQNNAYNRSGSSWEFIENADKILKWNTFDLYKQVQYAHDKYYDLTYIENIQYI